MTGNYDTELRKKLSSKIQLERIWRAAIFDESYEYAYTLKLPMARDKVALHLAEFRRWVEFWRQENRCWRLVTADRTFKELGIQHDFPTKIILPSAQDALYYLGKERELAAVRKIVQEIVQNFPQLAEFCLKFRQDLLKDKTLTAAIPYFARYFSGRYKTDCYLRELDIPFVDTKCMELHKKQVAALFQALHPELDCSGFETFCGLLHLRISAPTPNIYLRSLDPAKTFGGLREIMVTEEQLRELTVDFTHIFVTENKVNGYTFPKVADGLVIFGAGNGIVSSMKGMPWLSGKQSLWYWGDLDREGFRILSRFRARYPQTRSFLMEAELLTRYAHFCVKDTSDSGDMPDGLTSCEKAVWQTLSELPKKQNRLEQEKIPTYEIQEFLRREIK